LEAATCRNCDLYKDATQTVFGEGDVTAQVMLVGEQPGDREDLTGRPFVGPAGGLLDKAMDQVGIDRSKVYVTNVVKHFRFERRGKRRIHRKPNTAQIKACRPWLDEEIAATKPKLIVALGATAAQALLGPQFRLTKHRGEVIRREGLPPVTATVHPSSILRAPNDETRRSAMDQFVADLREALRRVGDLAAAS
jgi:DNA polymerase